MVSVVRHSKRKLYLKITDSISIPKNDTFILTDLLVLVPESYLLYTHTVSRAEVSHR